MADAEKLFLIVGLGNPGEDYELTRHNAGFMVVDELARRHGAKYWKSEGGAMTADTTVCGVKILLAKPLTFMNLSGSSVANLLKSRALTHADFVVIHDELDLAPDDVRIKQGGGHAGHNGLRSLHEKLGTDDYRRVRIGVGRPPGRMQAADYVLAKMRTQSEAYEQLEVSVQRAADMVEELVTQS